MILGRDFPEEEITWKELDSFTGKKPEKWTWTTFGLIQMKKRGYDVVNWRKFNYQKFVADGEKYLIERYGEEKGNAQIANCDLPYEIQNAKRLHKELETRQSLPTIQDIRELINDGYLIVCNVNLKALNDEPGYSGHFVLIYEANENELTMHDPGPPHYKARKVSHNHFLRAWDYPTEDERNLMAFKLS